MVRIAVFVIIGLVVIFVLASFVVPFFLPFGSWRILFEGLSKQMEAKQTIGEVTVNRDPKGVSIEEIKTVPWKIDSISPVIGKAYKITKLSNDNKPVHVEFAYNLSDIPKGISENFLHLYKWYEEAKVWVPVSSSVDPSRHVVEVDLKSFSILAVRAPVAAYIGQAEVDKLNRFMDKIQKDPPEDSCGIRMVIDEELVTWNGKDRRLEYSRPLDDTVEFHDCVANDRTKSFGVVSAGLSYEREGYSYVITPSLDWQLDPDEDAIVKGVIRDQRGYPLAGVTLSANKITYSPGQKSAVTDKNGQYELDLHSGEYKITVNPSGSSGNYSECNSADFNDRFFAWGTLPEKAHKVGPWTKDVTLNCPDFIIKDSQTIISDQPITSYMAQVDYHSEDTYISNGSQLEKSENGYGWEGKWEMTVNIKIKGSSSTTITGPNGVVVNLPASAVNSDVSYKFEFSIPSHPANDYALSLLGNIVSGANSVNTHGEAGVAKLNGKVVAEVPGSGGTGSNTPTWSLTGHLIDVSPDGATLKIDKLYHEPDNILIHIRRIKRQ